MIGFRPGVVCGLNAGVAAGISADPLGTAFSLATVAKDATSNIYCPASAAQWTQALGVAGIGSGGPFGLWLCQEASGNLADSIGSFTLTVAGAPTYQNAIAGWTRKALHTTDGGSQGWSTTSASLPNIGSTSCLLLIYLNLTANPAATHIAAVQGTTTSKVEFTSSSVPVITSAGNSQTGSTAVTTTVVPVVQKVDRTNSVVTLYTLADKITPTFSGTMTGQKLLLGTDVGSGGSPVSYLYAAAFQGAAAELSDARVKSLLQTLGWSPTWS